MEFFSVLFRQRRVKAISILLLASICILAACSGKNSNEISVSLNPTETSPTLRKPAPSLTVTPQNSIVTRTPLPKLTKTLSPTPTVIDSTTPTIENTQFIISQPLSQLMLTWEDVFGIDDGTLEYQDVYNQFVKNHHPTVVDVSSELSSTCLSECTKQIWATEQEEIEGYGGKMTVGRRLTIFMFRSSDSQRAKKTAENFFTGIPEVDSFKGDQYRNLVNAPSQNTYFGMTANNNRLQMIISTSIGPISFGVISWINGDDGMTDGEFASFFLNKQIKKIQDAAIVVR